MENSVMTQHPLFSIVLAGYRTEPYLQKALDSVANQTFRDFEVICYVEESPDRSLEICRAMAERDPRFKVATGPKSGSGGPTRNYGIDHASGEYIVFLDGDDWLLIDMLEKLAGRLAQTGPLDILAFACVTTQSEDVDPAKAGKRTNFSAQDADTVFSGPDAIRRVGRKGGAFLAYSVLNIYRTAFLRENHLYQPGGILEDFAWMPRVWYLAKRMTYLDEVFYVYRRRAGSLTTEASARVIYDIAETVLPRLFDLASGEPIPEDILTIWSNQWISMFYWFLFHPVTSGKISDDDRKKALNMLFAGDGWARFRRIGARTTRPKRLALPLIRLAAKGFPFPAKFYFSRLYYPLIERKGKGKKE